MACLVLDGDMSLVLQMDGDAELSLQMDGEFGEYIKVVDRDAPIYTGAVEVTPTEQQQILETADKLMLSNVTINPIPEKYGRLLYSGSTLTVY